MPAATPLPRAPSVLTLYGAADLLTAAGCPVCRYAAESADRYLHWFALEGHAQPATITRLCASLGTCALHTRRLMSQPGAAVRLTVVYRYVLIAARDLLTGRPHSVATCPACEHDDAASSRATQTLVEDLADSAVMDRCRELGGLCLPHLAAASLTARPRLVLPLAETALSAASARDVSIGWLAGSDPDAENRAALRRALATLSRSGLGVCPPCLAAARAEDDALAGLPGQSADRATLLCAQHLADAGLAADGVTEMRQLLTGQARCLTAQLASRRVRRQFRRHGPQAGCAVCGARQGAATQWLADRGGHSTGPAMLCVRHQLVLRSEHPRASEPVVAGAISRAQLLIDELAEAFDRATRARSLHDVARDTGAWRRAAAFLDGAVFGGGPPIS
jgi:hypothetical protein